MAWLAIYTALVVFCVLLDLAAWRGLLNQEAMRLAHSYGFATRMLNALGKAAIYTAVVWVVVFLYRLIFGS